MVLSGNQMKDLKIAMTKEDLDGCNGDAKAFVAKLREKGTLTPSKLA